MQPEMELFRRSLANFRELDVDYSGAEVDQAIVEFEGAWTNLKEVVAKERVDINDLEPAVDETERQIRSAGAGPL